MSSAWQYDPEDPSSLTNALKRGPSAVDLRFEIILFLLLLLTLAAVRFQDQLLAHAFVIEPGDVAHYTPRFYGDAANGGNSTIALDPHRPLSWQCTVRPKYAFPYCGYELLIDARTPNKGLNLSKFDTLTIDLDYTGPWETFRIYLKNYDPRYSRPGVPETLKYNKVEVAARPGHNVVQLKLADFGVAEWWVTQNNIRPGLSTPQLNNVTEIQFQTGTRAKPGIYHFNVHRVTLQGRVVGKATWYAAILAVWAIMIGLYLVYRIVRLRRDLEWRRESQAAALRLAQFAEESARRDYLTKLLNRTGVIDFYHPMAMNRHGDGSFAVILLDVDHFKTINDRFGHSIGDRVLADIATILTANTRIGDIVGRWGGEEFLLICNNCDEDGAISIANKLRASIELHEFTSVGRVTASLGVYCCTGPMDALEQLVSYADAALYAAKEQGRNRVVMYQPFMREAA
ncbi:GGDEF domain-containing protein [Sphingomonas crusticola]|uniref:GGDEF domain-containing protein n=1 Tax=Sphingomonas crusticola TaxID=1697973 RepID=UPI000E263066|nr:GGDEF domain-containing protein [Sphingomonas crusticola]